MDAPPVLIAGRYRLVRRVGSGGMGVVWEAWDERLHRTVAIKQLHAQLGLSDAETHLANERAMREARITARLDHPNAVPVFDVVEHDGQPCLIMQFLPSEPLSAVLRERRVLPFDEVARIGAQVASALAAAHALGIIHRDVKPGNVLMAHDGTARISDFGISHALGDVTLTSTGMVHGTPAYLAPEVARGAESSFGSDVFGLGATLYAAVEGAPPFGVNSNSIALLYKVASGEFDPPDPDGPLSPLLELMLAPNPDDRPTMSDVAAALRDAQGGGRSPNDATTRVIPAADSPTRPVRPTPWGAAAPGASSRPGSPAGVPATGSGAAAVGSAGSRAGAGAAAGGAVGSGAAALGPAAGAAAVGSAAANTGPAGSTAPPAGSTAPPAPPTVPFAASGGDAGGPSASPPTFPAAGGVERPVDLAEPGSPRDPGPPLSSPAAEAPRPRRTGLKVVAALVLLVGLGVLLANVVFGAGRDRASVGSTPSPSAVRSSASASASASATASATSEPPSASSSQQPSRTVATTRSPSRTASSRSTSPAPASTKTSSSTPPDARAELAAAVTSYYGLLPGDTDAGWHQLSSSYRKQTGGRRSYERFWGGMSSVSVSDVKASVPDRVTATIRYRQKSGGRSTERRSFQLVKDGSELKINASEVVSASG